MRLVKLLVVDEHLDTTLDLLEEEGIDFVVTESAGRSREASLVEFPLPTQAVEYVLGELRELGLDDREYTVIAGAATAKTTNYHELEERFVAGVEEDDAVAREEIRAKALDMHRNALTYYSMTLLSAVVAAAGLLLDSPAIVVGAMVIAPQVGSSLITSVGMSLNEGRMVKLGLRSQAAGLGLAIVGAFAFTFPLKTAGVVSASLDPATITQVSKRISPGLLSLSVAVAAGAAGAFGLATALPVSLVGVMIAAALIPAAAAVGIGVAWGAPGVALGAFVLLVVNAVAVNLAGFLVLWYLGYRPIHEAGALTAMGADTRDDGTVDEVADGHGLRERVREYGPTVAALAVLLTVFVAAAVPLGAQVAFDRRANDAVESVLDRPAYRDVRLSSVTTEVEGVEYLGGARTVSVVLTRPADTAYPALAAVIRDRLATDSGEPVTVEIEFRERQRAGPPT